MDNLQFLEANKYLIRYYYVYKHKSFHRAAENFYISCTDRNMKYTVTQLEDFYGVQLIKVTGNKLDFTDFGHLLGEQAEKIYEQNLKINSLLNKVNLKEVNFATTADFYKYYIKDVFYLFQKENPDTNITLIKTNQFDSTKKLLNREIDFIVGTLPVNPHPDLIYQEYVDAKILLCSHINKQENFDNITSLNDLLNYKGAMNDNTDPFYYIFNEAQDKLNIKLNMHYFTSDYESILDVVKNDFVDFAIVGNYQKNDDYFFKDISDFFRPIKICFIYRKQEALTSAIEKLIKISKKLNIKPGL